MQHAQTITPTPAACRAVSTTPLAQILAHARDVDGWLARAVEDPACVFEDLGVYAMPLGTLEHPVRIVRVWRPRGGGFPARTGIVVVWWTSAGWIAKGRDGAEVPEKARAIIPPPAPHPTPRTSATPPGPAPVPAPAG